MDEQPDAALLQLGLNALYALSEKLGDPAKIKAAFELRLACLAGFAPDLAACSVCGSAEPDRFDLSQGTLHTLGASKMSINLSVPILS